MQCFFFQIILPFHYLWKIKTYKMILNVTILMLNLNKVRVRQRKKRMKYCLLEYMLNYLWMLQWELQVLYFTECPHFFFWILEKMYTETKNPFGSRKRIGNKCSDVGDCIKWVFLSETKFWWYSWKMWEQWRGCIIDRSDNRVKLSRDGDADRRARDNNHTSWSNTG